ncbi:MAG TPA: hypothetical protein VLC98_17515 [Phnomibacter sp.]|nr:hypothetical protein [Phnomibacter sp.]
MKPSGINAFTLLTHQPAAMGQSFGISNNVVLRKDIGSDPLVHTGSPVFWHTHITSGDHVAHTVLTSTAFSITRVVNQNRNIILGYRAANNDARLVIYTANKKVLQYSISKQTIQNGIALENIPAGTYSVDFTSRLAG